MKPPHHHRSDRYDLEEIFDRERMAEFATWNPVSKKWYTTDKRIHALFLIIAQQKPKQEEWDFSDLMDVEDVEKRKEAPKTVTKDLDAELHYLTNRFDKMLKAKMLSAHTQILYKTTFKDYLAWAKENKKAEFNEDVVEEFMTSKKYKASVRNLKGIVFNQMLKYLYSPAGQKTDKPTSPPKAPEKNEIANRKILVRRVLQNGTPGNSQTYR